MTKIVDKLGTYADSIGDNVADVLRGDFKSGLGGLFENTLDFVTIGAYSKGKQIYDALNQDLPEQTYQDRQQMSVGADTPRQFVYGKCRIGGQLTYWETSGDDSRYMNMVVTLAPHRLSSINKIWFNDELAGTWSGLFFTPEAGFENVIKKIIRVEIPRTSALQAMVDSMAQWTSDHIGRGCSYVYLQLDYDRDVFSRGMPRISCEVEGKQIYDPRTMTSYYSDNHALVMLDYLRDDNGLNCDDDEIDFESFIVGANACDDLLPAYAGGTEKRYTVNGTVEYSATPIDNLDALRKAGKALINYEQGTWQYVAGTYTAPIAGFDESDLVGGISLITGPSKADLVNTVKGSYLDPRQDYEVVQFPEIAISEYISRDGEPLKAEVSAPFSTSPSLSRRLGKITIEETRFGVRCEATFKMRAIELLPGDRLTLSIARFGWVNKIFRITGGGQSISLDGGVSLSLIEDSPDVWDWTEGEALDVTAPPALILPDANINKPTGLVASEQLYATNISNNIKTRVTLSWESGGVRSVAFNVQSRKSGDAQWKELTTNWTRTDFIIEDSEVGGFEYRVQGVTELGRTSDWSSLLYTVQGKDAPPSDVPVISATQKSYGIDINWTPVPDADLAEYELRIDNNFGQDGAIYTGRQVRFTDLRRANGVTYYIKAIDTTGNYSENATTFTPIITGPKAVNSLNITSIDSNVLLRWSGSESIYPIQTYTIRRGPAFETAYVIGEFSGTFATSVEEEGGTFTYWVAPIDAGGNQGPEVQALASVDAPNDYVLRADDFVDFNLMDTLTDVALGQGGGGVSWNDTQLDWSEELLRWDDAPSLDLIGPVNTTETFLENMARSGLTYDTKTDWSNETELDWSDTTIDWSDIGGDPYQNKLDNGFTHWLDPSTSSGLAERIIDFEALIPNTRISVIVESEVLRAGATLKTVLSTSQDGIDWDVFPDNQTDINSSNFQYLRIQCFFEASGQGLQIIENIRFKLDVKQKTDQGQAQIYAADYDAGDAANSGTVIILNKAFIDIDSVVATAKANDAKIVITNFDDVGNQDRFRAVAFDRATGNAVDAIISWNARGS